MTAKSKKQDGGRGVATRKQAEKIRGLGLEPEPPRAWLTLVR
jgi:hypothetical protein